MQTAVSVARAVTFGRPHLIVVAATLVAFALAYLLAFLLRFEFTFGTYREFFFGTLPFALLIKLSAFYISGVFSILWAYVGIRDLWKILRATAFASAAMAAVNLLLLPQVFIPRTVLVIDGLLTFLTVSGVYAMLRSLREAASHESATEVPREPVFVIGAGDAGEALLRELQRNPASGARVVGFLDDEPAKHKQSLRGVRVLGTIAQAAELARDLGVRKAFVAIPSAPGSTVRTIVNHLLKANLAIKVLPPLGKLSAAGGFLPQLREVQIEDLLRRPPVKLDDAAISKFIRDKVVLVTGAAGSIGSEICRQVLDYHPAKLVALDMAETPLHDLLLELRQRVKDGILVPELADVTNRTRIEEVFAKHKPAVVFHAAALKHVPMCEAHPAEATRVNVGGTTNVAEIARATATEAFVMISTDKAVNPTSVMGATKRIAEMLVGSLRAETGTRFMSVRFGNVLGSNGSVIPIFKRQIAAGGPVTVTHPEMKRYFMLIPEAVQLVLQSCVLGSGGEIFVLDMGEPIGIVDLAEDVIRLSGLVPGKDIRLEFTGIRPGEKLFEELRLDTEAVDHTLHPRVFRLRGVPTRRPAIDGLTASPAQDLVSRLHELARAL